MNAFACHFKSEKGGSYVGTHFSLANQNHYFYTWRRRQPIRVAHVRKPKTWRYP